MSCGHEQSYKLSHPPDSGKLGPIYGKAVPWSFCFNLSRGGNGPGLGWAGPLSSFCWKLLYCISAHLVNAPSNTCFQKAVVINGEMRHTASGQLLGLASPCGNKQLGDSRPRVKPFSSLSTPYELSSVYYLVTYAAGQKPSSSRQVQSRRSPSPTWLPWDSAPAWKKKEHMLSTGVYKETDPAKLPFNNSPRARALAFTF